MARGCPSWAPSWRHVLLFCAATACKFIEPIAVDLSKSTPPDRVTTTSPALVKLNGSLPAGGGDSGQEPTSSFAGDGGSSAGFAYSFGVALALAEAIKVCLLSSILASRRPDRLARRILHRLGLASRRARAMSSGGRGGSPEPPSPRQPAPAVISTGFTRDNSSKIRSMYAVSALLLALCNQSMFVGIATLGPLLYSIVFQATSTLSTGVVSEIIMGEPLTMAQWGSLAVLICGFCLTLPGFDPYDMTSVFASLDGGAGGTGLAITTFGGCAFSTSAVLFEKAAKADSAKSVLVQSMIFAAWGFASNLILFALTAKPVDYANAFVGFDDAKVWRAVLGIVFADISMTILFKQLGSNTYSFSRAISTCSLGIYAFAMGGAALQSQFWIGAALVTTAAFMYKSGGA